MCGAGCTLSSCEAPCGATSAAEAALALCALLSGGAHRGGLLMHEPPTPTQRNTTVPGAKRRFGGYWKPESRVDAQAKSVLGVSQTASSGAHSLRSSACRA